MAQDMVVILSASVATTAVGWVIFLYLRGMRRKVRRHILRNEEIDKYFKR